MKRGLSIRPREPWLSDLLANVLFQGRRADELEDLGNDLLVAHPAHPTAHYHLARAHYLRGDRHAAFARAQDGLQVDPDNYECLFLAAHLSRDVGQAELECERIQAAIRAAGQAHMQAELRLAEAEALRLGCAPR